MSADLDGCFQPICWRSQALAIFDVDPVWPQVQHQRRLRAAGVEVDVFSGACHPRDVPSLDQEPDLARRLTTEAERNVKENFSAQAMAATVESIYERCLAE